MRRLIKDIYRLTESRIVTPQNLVANITLPNYKEINFKNDGENIICKITEVNGFYYIYYFDVELKLNKAMAFIEDEEIILFDREIELKKLLNEYDDSIVKNKKVI
ncbi:hypothetical protein [Enterococcus durans]|uniref:hypothetical protein n=1 Tax=Enterococcus durans TaxID=53345 RepID=UPI001D09DBEC|nr:hypothetical protein [Enterococcus durans]MCB8506027.1 hypothetical protein [Enterococcus durans]MCB8515834.1 hypothetical protein [Enterococcus durans]